MKSKTSPPLYLFFAPPRVGNHYVEMILSGLYPIAPMFIFHADGNLRSDLQEQYGTTDLEKILSEAKPYQPALSKENPTLFIEYNQPLSDEVITRGNELDLEKIRKLIQDSDQEQYVKPLVVQWYHDGYHAPPYRPLHSDEIELRYIFVIRSPQAMAYSHFRIIRDRWQCYVKEGENAQNRFSDFYTRDMLNEYWQYLKTVQDLSSSEKVFIFRYEETLNSPIPLISFCNDFVGYKPKLSARDVHERTRIGRIRKSSRKASFYREGKKYGWMQHLDLETLAHMIQVESDFNFKEFGYPSTQELRRKHIPFISHKMKQLFRFKTK